MHVTFEPGTPAFINHRADVVNPTQGPFINLKHEPTRASELPEATEWPALGEFIKQVNLRLLFQTTGCDVSGHTHKGPAYPFVDIAFYDEPLAHSERAYARLRMQLLTLSGGPSSPELSLILWDSCAARRDGTKIRALRLWIAGSRRDADDCFREILGVLDRQKYADYEQLALSDHYMKLLLRIVMRVVVFGWLAVGATHGGCAGFMGASAVTLLTWFVYRKVKSRSYTFLDWR